jgi:hypothetical protein
MKGLHAVNEVLESRSVEYQLIEEHYQEAEELWGFDSRHNVL